MNIMQGDGYSIPVSIKNGTSALADTDVLDVEISIGRISKCFSYDEIHYDSSSETWYMPVTQEETLSLCGPMPMQVRVKFPNGDVVGTSLGRIDVLMSLSREVL